METTKDIFDIFLEDESYKYIMKRLLEASMEESFNSIVITEAGPGYPIIYVNAAFCELTGYGPHEVMGKSPSLLQGPTIQIPRSSNAWARISPMASCFTARPSIIVATAQNL